MKATSTESVGSCASSFQPRRRLLFEDDPDQNLEMTNPFASPPQQQGQFRNSFASDSLPLSRGAVSLSIPSDRPVIPITIVQNAPGVVKPGSPSFSPWQNEKFNFNTNRNACERTQVPSTQNTPEPVKTSYGSEGYNGNKCVTPGAGGSGPSDRQALVKVMMDGDELPKCPCGSGPCIVLTSRTEKNPNRRFYKCPATIKCKFFKWCDELDQSSKSPSKPTQETRSPGKISKPQNTPLKPDNPVCFCKAGPCVIRTMHEGENKGRKYYACPIMKGFGPCKHLEWIDNPVKPPEAENNSNGSQNNLLIADVTTPEPKQTFSMPQWVDNQVRPLETLNNSNGNQNKLSIADVTTPEPKKTFSMPQWVDNPARPLETLNNSNGNQNKLSIADVTTPEPKQRRTLSPYESVKDLFGEDDMKSIEYWCKDQNDPNSTAAIEHERSKELSPGKRPHPPNTLGEISPMKRLNLSESIPAVGNCPRCGAIGQCIECPILTCFKDDEFAEKKHENAMNGGGISNLANISPIGGMVVQNATPSSSKRSGKCFNCGKEGHWRSECTSPLGANSSCFKCGKLGHWMRNCKP